MDRGPGLNRQAAGLGAVGVPGAARGRPSSRGGLALGLIAGVALAWIAVVALTLRLTALPADASGKLLVLFPPSTSGASSFAAIIAAGGAPVRPTLGDWAWVAHAEDPGFVGRLEAAGALAAFRGVPTGMALAGCLAFATDDHAPFDPIARALAARLAAQADR